ncbi:MAG: hypothetical protein R3D71_06405 [Rickettsiales bacterium]
MENREDEVQKLRQHLDPSGTGVFSEQRAREIAAASASSLARNEDPLLPIYPTTEHGLDPYKLASATFVKSGLKLGSSDALSIFVGSIGNEIRITNQNFFNPNGRETIGADEMADAIRRMHKNGVTLSFEQLKKTIASTGIEVDDGVVRAGAAYAQHLATDKNTAVAGRDGVSERPVIPMTPAITREITGTAR